MNDALFFSFLAATFLIMITPGPSVALVTSQAMRHGSRAAIYTVTGDALGSVVHIVVATIGFQFLIAVASSVLPWLQVAGGGYILYLAYQSYIAAGDALDVSSAEFDGSVEALVSGFIACVSNPKAIIFFAALFPGFIDPNYNIPLQSAVYGVTFIVLDVFSILAYAMATVFIFRTSVLKRMNHNILSAVGLLLIGLFLVAKGAYEVAT